MKNWKWGLGLGIFLFSLSLGTQQSIAHAENVTSADTTVVNPGDTELDGLSANQISQLEAAVNNSKAVDPNDNVDIWKIMSAKTPIEELGHEFFKLFFIRDSFDINLGGGGDITTAPDYGGMVEDHNWFSQIPTETITRQSDDGLKLSAKYIKNGNSKKTAIIAHGYHGSNNDAASWAKMYYDLGYNILAPDARSHGESEGRIITFGWAERNDYKGWIQQMIETTGQDTDIVLQGVSMGAATVMMTGGEDLPENVRAVIEDCGYTSVSDEISYLGQNLKVPLVNRTLLEIHGIDRLNAAIKIASDELQEQAGISIDEMSSINQVKKNTLPQLFIRGDNDDFVPTEMVNPLFEASPAVYKKKVLIKDGPHGVSMAYDRLTYHTEVTNFVYTVSTMELQDYITKGTNLTPTAGNRFTAETKANLKTVLKTAQSVLDKKAAATQTEVDNVTLDLKAAISNVVEEAIPTTTELQVAIDQAKAAKAKDGYEFTAETQQALKDKLQAAEAVLANANATQAEIDQVTSDLNTAFSALKEVKTTPAPTPTPKPDTDKDTDKNTDKNKDKDTNNKHNQGNLPQTGENQTQEKILTVIGATILGFTGFVLYKRR